MHIHIRSWCEAHARKNLIICLAAAGNKNGYSDKFKMSLAPNTHVCFLYGREITVFLSIRLLEWRKHADLIIAAFFSIFTVFLCFWHRRKCFFIEFSKNKLFRSNDHRYRALLICCCSDCCSVFFSFILFYGMQFAIFEFIDTANGTNANIIT